LAFTVPDLQGQKPRGVLERNVVTPQASEERDSLSVSERHVRQVKDQWHTWTREMQLASLPKLGDASACQSTLHTEPDVLARGLNKGYPQHSFGPEPRLLYRQVQCQSICLYQDFTGGLHIFLPRGLIVVAVSRCYQQ
jgi:hypothetical protein